MMRTLERVKVTQQTQTFQPYTDGASGLRESLQPVFIVVDQVVGGCRDQQQRREEIEQVVWTDPLPAEHMLHATEETEQVIVSERFSELDEVRPYHLRTLPHKQ